MTHKIAKNRRASDLEIIDKPIVHVSRNSLSRSSRIQYQMSYDDGAHIGETKLLDYQAIRRIFQNRRLKQVIFHQHACLPNLILALCYRAFSRNKINIAFDIHDLLEFQLEDMTPKKFAFFIMAFALQRIVFASNVNLLTVSPDIADLITQKYRVHVTTILNTARQKTHLTSSELKKEKRIVYFGSINNERLKKEALMPFFEAGYKLDVYGVFGQSFTEHDLKSLALREDQINYLGPYEAHNILKYIEKYCASWMVFGSKSQNYKFCLPNKLFQSLSVGVPCIVHENMISARNLAKVGFEIYTDVDFITLDVIPRSPINLYMEYEEQNMQTYLKTIVN